MIELAGQRGVVSAERTWPRARDGVDGMEGRGCQNGFEGGRRPENGVEEGHDRGCSGVGGKTEANRPMNEVEPSTEESKRSEIRKFVFSSNLYKCAPVST